MIGEKGRAGSLCQGIGSAVAAKACKQNSCAEAERAFARFLGVPAADDAAMG